MDGQSRVSFDHPLPSPTSVRSNVYHRIQSASTFALAAILLSTSIVPSRGEAPDVPQRHTVRYGGGVPTLFNDAVSSQSPRATAPLPSVIYAPSLPADDAASSMAEQDDAKEALAFLEHSVPVGYPTLVAHVTAATLIEQMKQEQVTRDPIYDVIQGTSLQGSALSKTTITPQLLPSEHGIAAALHLNTRAQIETTGTDNAATVYNRGTTDIQGYKQVLFTPTQILTYKAQASANVQADIVGFQWQRPLGEQIARRRAYEQEPQIEAISSVNTGKRARKQLDRQVDRQMAKLETQLRANAAGQLARLPMRPDHVQLRSTREAAIAEVYFGDGRIGSFPPTLQPNGSQQGMAVQIHQSLLAAAMDPLNDALAGQTVEEEDWSQLTNLLPVSTAAQLRPDRRKWILQMPDDAPLTTTLTDKGMRVAFKVAAFKVGTTAYPGMLIETNFTPTIKDGQLIAVRDDRLTLTPLPVQPAKPAGSDAAKPSNTKPAENAADKPKPRRRLGVRQNIFRSMVRKRFDPVFAKELPIGDQHRSLGGNRYSISDIEISNEWATLQAVPAS